MKQEEQKHELTQEQLEKIHKNLLEQMIKENPQTSKQEVEEEMEAFGF